MEILSDVAALQALYGEAVPGAIDKVADRLTPGLRAWVEAGRFVILSTVGPEGADGSPRGDEGPVLSILDDRTLALPDWRGNNRLDTLRNIVRDGRCAAMILVPGERLVLRVNGRAVVTADAALRQRFARPDGTQPASVIVLRLAEAYLQCGRAVLRAGLWDGVRGDALPGTAQIRAEINGLEPAAPESEADWLARAARTLW